MQSFLVDTSDTIMKRSSVVYLECQLMALCGDLDVFPSHASSEASRTDREECYLFQSIFNPYSHAIKERKTYWKRDVHDVIDNNFLLYAPDIIKQVLHDPAGFIPDHSIVRLPQCQAFP